jgi:hypothetical protein
MAESTLQLTWTEIETEVARSLGFDRTEGNWTASQVLDIAAIIKRGARQFYFPQRTDPAEMAHKWTFLRPQSTLTIWDDVIATDAITVSTAVYADPVTTITASASVFFPTMEEKTMAFDENSNTFVIDEYVSETVVKVTGNASAEAGNTITIDSADTFTLPWDYGGMAGDGRFSYDTDENTLNSIEVTSDANIRNLRQWDTSTGIPYLVAIVPLRTDATQPQRWTAMFHQPPNDEFVLHYRYAILPDALIKTTEEYPYGSAAHSETLLESCLAIAELRERDSAQIHHQQRYALFLQSSIDEDKKHGDPTTHFGYNGDGSDGHGHGHQMHGSHYGPACWRRHNELVTFNGNDGS